MQRVGFQRFARGFVRHAVEQPRPEEIDHDRNDDHAERPERRFDRVAVAAEQPVRRLPDHHAGQHEQQRGLGERGDALDLAVAVVVLLVGRLAGNAHGEIGHHGGEKSISECAASDSSASDPERKPTTALATVKPAETAIDVSATFSFSLCIAL